MVMVTSRTVVADRVEIPQATPIAKLADFDDGQVGEWLGAWRRVNGGAGPTVEEALAHEQLARQPLLLLMLAIYWAESDRPAEMASLTLNNLYRHLFRSFALREVGKRKRLFPVEGVARGSGRGWRGRRVGACGGVEVFRGWEFRHCPPS
jgi:hypothetical protein